MVYTCKFSYFGCDVTRSKKYGILKHESQCIFAKKFQKFIDLEQEVIFLRQENSRLKTATHHCRTLKYTKFSDFKNLLLSDIQLQKKWYSLSLSNPLASIKPLIVLFINVFPYFYRLISLNEIEVNVCLPCLRTNKREERHSMETLVWALFDACETLITENCQYFKLPKFQHISNFTFRQTNKRDKAFLYNAMTTALKRKQGQDIFFMKRQITDYIPLKN